VKELIRKVIKEEVGVPSNIVNVANQIYNHVIENIVDTDTVEEINNVKFYYEGKFRIGDLKFKMIDYMFQFHIDDDYKIEIAGMATEGGLMVTKKFKIKSMLDKNDFHLQIVMTTPPNTTGKDIKDYMKKEKIVFISSITHELKHKYDKFKKPKTSLTARGEYMAFTNNNFENIDTINKFIHNLYFTHTAENLVRPSELAGAIESGEISKKGFYKFLTNNQVFKKLKEIQGFTYEGFREQLKNDIDKIKTSFDNNDIDYEGLSDDEIVDKILELLLLNLRDWKMEKVRKILVNSPIEMVFGFQGAKGEFFNNYLRKLSKYGGDFEKYFKYEEKMFNFVATKMIKKISKVYSMVKNETNESIIDWELWHKVKGTNSNIVTESESWADRNHLLPKKHPMVQAIIKVIGEAEVFNDSYSLPYSENDDMEDYQIDYHIDKVSLWVDDDGEYNGTIYLMLDKIILGDSEGNDWERVYYRDDLPSFCWDRMEEDIIERIEKWIPNVGVDIELVFPGYKG
jgi:hypothetical protein